MRQIDTPAGNAEEAERLIEILVRDGGTRRLVSQLGASTSGGVVDLCTS